MTSAANFLERLDKILVYRKGEQRAPHKPLYLLFCLASLQHGLPRLQRFDAISNALSVALHRFGPRTKSLHPEYPFWRLQHDNLAVVEADEVLEYRQSNNDPTKSSLLKANAVGGLTEQDYALLVDDIDLQSITAHKLLDKHFPASIHDEVIRHFNLKLNDPHSKDLSTEREFREAVLSAYRNSCALTAFSLKYQDIYYGIEAAHICWAQVGGNDDITNGIAMSTLHRKLFHLGLFAINDEDYTVCVSTEALEDKKAGMSLRQLHGKPIALPEDSKYWPSKKALSWHSRWVFRG
jgi:putative restriction endonuclease